MTNLQNIKHLKKYDFIKNIKIINKHEGEMDFFFTAFKKYLIIFV